MVADDQDLHYAYQLTTALTTRHAPERKLHPELQISQEKMTSQHPFSKESLLAFARTTSPQSRSSTPEFFDALELNDVSATDGVALEEDGDVRAQSCGISEPARLGTSGDCQSLSAQLPTDRADTEHIFDRNSSVPWSPNPYTHSRAASEAQDTSQERKAAQLSTDQNSSVPWDQNPYPPSEAASDAQDTSQKTKDDEDIVGSEDDLDATGIQQGGAHFQGKQVTRASKRKQSQDESTIDRPAKKMAPGTTAEDPGSEDEPKPKKKPGRPAITKDKLSCPGESGAWYSSVFIRERWDDCMKLYNAASAEELRERGSPAELALNYLKKWSAIAKIEEEAGVDCYGEDKCARCKTKNWECRRAVKSDGARKGPCSRCIEAKKACEDGPGGKAQRYKVWRPNPIKRGLK